MRMLNSAFDSAGAQPGDYYPEGLRRDIDQLNERIYHAVNNGVYRAGFATTQEAYEEAAFGVFAMLDELEKRLASSRYLFGDRPLETDWRLFTTLVRFDAVYFGHFKCNLRRLVDYPNLSRYTRDLYHFPRIANTVNFDHIRRHYYTSHKAINPNGIVPIGPELDFSAPQERGARPL
jgi:putative glutathione S-transferase